MNTFALITPVGAMDDDFPLVMEREAGAGPNVDAVAVAFGIIPKKNGDKSRAAGHDVFEDCEYVKIAVPGDQKSIFFQPAEDSHRMRFPVAYRAFKDRESGEKSVEGMPLENWPLITRSLALTFRAAHVRTVEALAAVPDAHIDRFGSAGRELRRQAQTWLSDAKGGAEAARVASENEALKGQLASLQAQITALNARLKPDDRIDPNPPPPAAVPLPPPVAVADEQNRLKAAAKAARKPSGRGRSAAAAR